MLNEVLLWGLKPLYVTGDNWYSSSENLKLMRHHELSFLFAIKMYRPKPNQINKVIYEDFKRIHNNHWNIEQFHRALKQVCNVERFQVRNTKAITNHIFCAISAFVKLELMRVQNRISNWYEIQKNLFNEVIRNFIQNESLNGLT